jgi:hypothetical protein
MALHVTITLVLLTSTAALAQSTQAVNPYAKWPHGPSTDPSYFPIGVWVQSPDNVDKYKAIGVNLYVGLWKGPTAEQLAKLKAAGMQTIVHQNEVGLDEQYRGLIVGWLQQDEPDNAQGKPEGGYGPPVPPADVIKRYEKMKGTDPTRPVLLNLGQGVAWDGWYGRGVRTNHPEDYAEYAKAADILSFDIYPATARKKDEVHGQIWRVGYGTKRLRAWARPDQPVWTFVETTNIDGDGQATPEQVRAEVWMAIVNGAQGILYFCHQMKPTFNEDALLDDERIRPAVAAINAQVRELAPVLNGPTYPGRVLAETSDREATVEALAKVSGDDVYVFAVSTRDRGAATAFTIAGLPARATAEVLGENRRIDVRDGGFEDAFKPYAVHLYRIRPQ